MKFLLHSVLLIFALLQGCSKTNQPPSYTVTCIDLPYVDALSVVFKYSKSPKVPSSAPAQLGMTFLLGVLDESEYSQLMAEIFKLPLIDSNGQNQLQAIVEMTLSTTRDLKISGPPWNGKDMDTFITVYPSQTVLMASTTSNSDGDYHVFLVSPK